MGYRKEFMMTYGELKKRIYSLLDIDGREEETAGSLAYLVRDGLTRTINAVARKAAVLLKSVYKTETLYFEKSDIGLCASLPADAAIIKEICKEKRRYGAVCFERIGDKLYFFGTKEGFYTVGYYAYPQPLAEGVRDGAVLEAGDVFWDAVAYGVCAELCTRVYPSDMKRYMRLATEFDSRMTADSSSAGDTRIRDGVFSKKRGIG